MISEVNIKPIQRWNFDYIYMVIMIVYMACMTPETQRMSSGGLKENLIGFFIPILLTIVICNKHIVNFKNIGYKKILGISLLWVIASTIKYGAYNVSNVSYMFFVIYPIIIAFVHVQVFGRKLFDYYEDIMVGFCKISLVLWLFSVLFNGAARSFFGMFPEEVFGPNFLYIFHFMDSYQYTNGIMRNAGFSWEPGRFAIMVCLAIFINLSKNGVEFKQINIWILLVTLATTMSTTGYTTAFILYAFYFLKNSNPRNILLILLVFIPLATYVVQLDFMQEKIQEQSMVEESNETLLQSAKYHNSEGHTERIASLERFQSMYWELENMMHDPLLGYSTDLNQSYFRREITEVFTLTGGLVKFLAQHGLLFGLLFYFLLFKSSIAISKEMPYANKYAFAILILLSSVSYPIFGIPIYTALWLYGPFKEKEIT